VLSHNVTEGAEALVSVGESPGVHAVVGVGEVHCKHIACEVVLAAADLRGCFGVVTL